MNYSLSMTFLQHAELKGHLVTPSGNEKVVWVLCGRAVSCGRVRLLVQSIYPLPEDAYVDVSPVQVTWKTSGVVELFDKAEAENLVLVKFHSHPAGCHEFSSTDDKSDKEMLAAICDWIESPEEFVSCIMTPDGRIEGRTVGRVSYDSLTHVMIVGYDITFFERWSDFVPGFAKRNVQAFGDETFRILRNIRVGVAGCSGTGSQVIEQLVRLGVGELVLVDYDRVEEKNLNRISNLTMQDAISGRLKVEALKEKIEGMGLGTKVIVVSTRLETSEAVRALSVCDIVFGCLDTKGGRHTLNRLTSFYTIPYFDVGVRLDADGCNGINGINASVHYLQPGKKSLLHRGVYDMEDVRAENKYIDDPEGYVEEFGKGYVKGVNVDRPAVIPINAIASSFAVIDLFARIHDFRSSGNDEVDKILISV